MILARVARLRGEPAQIGIGLGQVGEFSFVLGSAAAAAGAIGSEVYAAILGAVVITIIGSTCSCDSSAATRERATGALAPPHLRPDGRSRPTLGGGSRHTVRVKKVVIVDFVVIRAYGEPPSEEAPRREPIDSGRPQTGAG